MDKGNLREARAFKMRQAIHSVELEGGHVSAGARSDIRDYVDGKIDGDGLVARIKVRHGVGQP